MGSIALIVFLGNKSNPLYEHIEMDKEINKTMTTGQQRTAPKPLFPVQASILQRKCACGNHTTTGGECADCAKKKMGLQRKLIIGASNDPLEQEADRIADQVMPSPDHGPVSGAPVRVQRFTGNSLRQEIEAPSSIERVLAGSGQPLEPGLRERMEGRFGYDFSRIRVHTGTTAEQSAGEVNANAYTVGNNVVFGAGQFTPETHKGQKLIAHELTHVVQQGGAAYSQLYIDRIVPAAERQSNPLTRADLSQSYPATIRRTAATMLQRQGSEDSGRRSRQLSRARPFQFQLQEPVLGQSLGFRRPSAGLNLPQLQLDPQTEAQIRAIQLIRVLISIENITRSLESLDGVSEAFTVTPPGSSGLLAAPPQSTADLEMRTADIGDLIRAILQIPAVQLGINTLRSEAEHQFRTNWDSLTTAEGALVITHGIILSGVALTGILSHPQGRQFLLDLVQDRRIPVPSLPMTIQFNLTGQDQRIEFDLDISAFLPPWLGFGRPD